MEKVKKVSPFRLNSLLRAQKDPKLALQLFLNPNPNPNSNPKPFRYTLLTYDLIITRVGRAKMFDELDQILAKLKLETRFSPTEIIFCNIITFYCRARLPNKALQVFDEMPSFRCQRTVKSLNSLLNGLLICREYNKMWRIFLGLDEFADPDGCSYNIMINSCCVRGDLEGAWKLFDEMRERGIRPNEATFATLIGGLCSSMKLKEAIRLKRDMVRVHRVKPNVYVYGSLIKGLCRGQELDLAFELKDEMIENKLRLNSHIYTALISGLFKAGRKAEVDGILEELKRNGCKPDNATYCAMISGFCNENDLETALGILNEMKQLGFTPDVLCFNVLIRAYCKEGKLREAMNLFEDMPRQGCKPDVLSYRILFDGFCCGMELEEAARILDEMIFKGYAPHYGSTYKCVDMMCQEGNLHLLSNVLHRLAKEEQADANCWEMAISTVCKDQLLDTHDIFDALTTR